MEWDSRDGIAKLLVGFETKLYQCFPRDLSSFYAYSLKIEWNSSRFQLKRNDIYVRPSFTHICGMFKDQLVL